MECSWTSTLRKSGDLFNRVIRQLQGTEMMTLAARYCGLQDLLVREEVRRLESMATLARMSPGSNDLLSADDIYREAYQEMHGH